MKAAKKSVRPAKVNWGERLCHVGRDVGLASMVFHNAIATKLGLNSIDHRCLDLLHVAGTATPGEIATWTGLTTGAVTAMLDRLERAGYVRREAHADDRRKVVIRPVPGRWEEVGRLFEPLGAGMGQLSEGYSQADLEVIVDYMTRAAELFRRETRKLTETSPQ